MTGSIVIPSISFSMFKSNEPLQVKDCALQDSKGFKWNCTYFSAKTFGWRVVSTFCAEGLQICLPDVKMEDQIPVLHGWTFLLQHD